MTQCPPALWWGALFIVMAIAIAREGSEIVVFLSGIVIVMGLNTADTMWSLPVVARYRRGGTVLWLFLFTLPENCLEMVFRIRRYCAVVPCLFAAA